MNVGYVYVASHPGSQIRVAAIRGPSATCLSERRAGLHTNTSLEKESKMKITVLVLAAAVAALVAVPALAQTVPNWDCELGINPPVSASATNTSTAVTGWDFYKGSVATLANWTIGISTDAYAGTYAGYLMLKADGKNGYYRTTVTGCTVGTPYMVKAWMKHTGYGFVQLLARPKGGSTVSGGQHASDIWSQEQLDAYVYPNALGEIEIEVKEYTQAGIHPTYGDYSTGLFDNVTITAIPEPGSMLALLSGLVSLAGFAVRRRK